MIEHLANLVLFLTGYRLIYFTGECDVTEQATPLGEEENCLQLSIENPKVNEDNTDNLIEVLYGDRTRQRRRLLPGYSTDWIPVSEARQLRVRTPTASGQTVTITYSGTRI